MSSDLILEKIEAIAATSSKTAKEDMIRASAELEGFQDVLEAALNPFKTYGIAKRPDTHRSGGNGTFNSDTWHLLENLRTRNQIGRASCRERVYGLV